LVARVAVLSSLSLSLTVAIASASISIFYSALFLLMNGYDNLLSASLSKNASKFLSFSAMGSRSGKFDQGVKALCLLDTLAILAEQEAQCHGLVLVSIASS
jgi:hypothetical protein